MTEKNLQNFRSWIADFRGFAAFLAERLCLSDQFPEFCGYAV